MNYVNTMQWIAAVRMWRKGKDTAQIAERLGVSEAMIYRKLPIYRDKWRGIDLSIARKNVKAD